MKTKYNLIKPSYLLLHFKCKIAHWKTCLTPDQVLVRHFCKFLIDSFNIFVHVKSVKYYGTEGVLHKYRKSRPRFTNSIEEKKLSTDNYTILVLIMIKNQYRKMNLR
jgi:hypothetical protein